MIIEYRGKRPRIAPSAFVAPTAVLIGDVEVGPESSIWFGAVLRGDNGPIRIGARTSIQDNAVVHVSEGGGTLRRRRRDRRSLRRHGRLPHRALRVDRQQCDAAQRRHDRRGRLIAAGSVVGQNAAIPPRVVAAGAPATVKKTLEGGAAAWIEISAPNT